jgi:hypothetical protein
MSRTTKKLVLVLAAVLSLFVTGAALSGCDHGDPSRNNRTR